jgi:hypothetical protein
MRLRSSMKKGGCMDWRSGGKMCILWSSGGCKWLLWRLIILVLFLRGHIAFKGI